MEYSSGPCKLIPCPGVNGTWSKNWCCGGIAATSTASIRPYRSRAQFRVSAINGPSLHPWQWDSAERCGNDGLCFWGCGDYHSDAYRNSSGRECGEGEESSRRCCRGIIGVHCTAAGSSGMFDLAIEESATREARYGSLVVYYRFRMWFRM
jgi:hypothetical protein